MPAVLVRVTIAMRKQRAQKQAGEERVCLVYTSTSLLILIGSHGRSLDAELMLLAGLPTARSHGGIFSIEGPSSQKSLVCVKLT